MFKETKKRRFYALIILIILVITGCSGSDEYYDSKYSYTPEIQKPSIDEVPEIREPSIDNNNPKTQIPSIDNTPKTKEPSIGNNNPKTQTPSIENTIKKDTLPTDESPKVESYVPLTYIGDNNLVSVKVAILDSDFKSKKIQEKLEKNFRDRIEVVAESKSGNGSEHGLKVAEAFIEQIDKHKAKNIGVVGYTLSDAGEAQGMVSGDNNRMTKKIYDRVDIQIYNLSLGTIGNTIEYFVERKDKIKDLIERSDNINVRNDGYWNRSDYNEYQKLYNDPLFRYAYEIKKNRDLYQPYVDKGKIFVWAAGNSNSRNEMQPLMEVTLNAGLPTIIEDLEKGWLAVVGVDPKTKKHYAEEEASYGFMRMGSTSNPQLASAGLAKNWTISASGNLLDTVPFGEGGSYGSSYAAPRVSAALALVKQRYPWMDNNNLRQTILTTAEDIGDSGVDDKYGWGYLNIDDALKGPAIFDMRLTKLTDSNGRFIAKIPHGTISKFENKISGDGGLLKTGNGELHLEGKSTYQGQTDIEEGTLVISAGSDFTGDFNVNLGSKLFIQFKDSNTPITNIGGNLQLDGEIGVKAEKFISIDSEGTYPLMLVLGNISGNTENNLISGGSISGKYWKDGDIIKAKLRREDMVVHVSKIPEVTKSDLNVANNVELAFKKLDKAVESGDKTGVSEEFLNTAVELQNMSKASLLDATKKLSGEIYASSQALSYTQAQAINRALTDRLNEISSDNFNKFGNNVWISGIGTRGKVQEEGYATGKTNMFGTEVGIDKALNRDIILGLSINQSKLNTKFEKFAGKSTGNSLGISAYGRIEFGKSEISKKTSQKINNESRSFIQGRIGANFITPEVERTVLTKTSTIKRKDVVNSLYGEIGHDFKNSSLTLTPYLGAGYTSINRGSFKEKTKDKESIPWSLESESKKYSQTSLNAGLRAKYEIKSITGLKTDINANINHVKNLGDNNLDFKAKYIGLSTEEIEVKGINLPKSSTWIGIGLNTEVTEKLGLQVNYNAKIEKGSLADSVVSAGINYRF